ITVYNKTSGQQLESARVELVYGPEIPDPPFILTKATNSSGQVEYLQVRSINTTVDITKPNFLSLPASGDPDWVNINEGVETLAYFYLTERPWPFRILTDGDDVNVSQPVVVDFRTEMDPSTIIDTSNYRLTNTDEDSEVGFTLTAKDSNRKVDIRPTSPLDFDTNYTLRLDTGFRDDGGSRLLWRAMTGSFRTELPPGTLSGNVMDGGDGSPVSGLRVKLIDQTAVTDGTGHFEFPVVPAGSYRLEVEESFLYNGTSLTGVRIDKGEDLELEDIHVDPKNWGSLEVKVLSGGDPLEGAWVNLISPYIWGDHYNLTTNSTGSVHYPRVVVGAVTMEIGADHHSTRPDVALVKKDELKLLTVNLVEDPLPVSISPAQVNPDGTVPQNSNFMITLSEAIKFSTLNLTMFQIDEDGSVIKELPILPPGPGGDELTYIIDPPPLLLESRYMFVLSKELMTLNDPRPILWRDLYHIFRTPELPLSHLNGSLLFDAMPLEGFPVRFGGFEAETLEDGSFNITVDLSVRSMEGEFSVNGSMYGYITYTETVEIEAGEVIEMGNIDLHHLPQWYSVIPSDGSENIEPDTDITFQFKVGIMVPEEDKWTRLLSVIEEGSNAPISGSYSVSNGNRTVVMTPADTLGSNKIYTVRISKDLKREDNITMFPVGNRTTFKVKPPSIGVTLLEPSVLEDVPIDSEFRLAFNFPVVRESIQSGLLFDPSASGIGFEWLSDMEVKVTAYLSVDTQYELVIQSGVYGKASEPLVSPYTVEFTTGDTYGLTHSLTNLQLFPDPEEGWITGDSITISGGADSSKGYIVRIVMKEGGKMVLEEQTSVDEQGQWTLNITVPGEPGTYTLDVELSMPGGPVAASLSYTVEVREEGVIGGDDEDLTPLLIAAVIIALVIILVVGAILFARNQRRRAEEELSVDYTDVEGDWEDPEE
ncbi:MAG: Ig-like domain-containing protein, partial [Thermoplasmatota archaeon]